MKIMMYFDGTDRTKETLPAVKMRAKAFNAHVDVVSSLPSGGETQLREIEKREDDLAFIKSSLEDHDISCNTHLLIKGHRAMDDVVHFAKEHKVDEIIIGADKKSRIEQFFTGWRTQHVINNARCPVVVI